MLSHFDYPYSPKQSLYQTCLGLQEGFRDLEAQLATKPTLQSSGVMPFFAFGGGSGFLYEGNQQTMASLLSFHRVFWAFVPA